MKKYILIFCSLTLLFACKNKKEITENVSPSKEVVSEVQEKKVEDINSKTDEVVSKEMQGLIGKYWKLTELNGKAVVVNENIREPHIKFLPNNQFSGHGGCNSFFGEFKIENNRNISFSNIGMTEMECHFDHYDQKFTDALSIPAQFILVGEDELRLQLGKRMPHAKFKAIYF